MIDYLKRMFSQPVEQVKAVQPVATILPEPIRSPGAIDRAALRARGTRPMFASTPPEPWQMSVDQYLAQEASKPIGKMQEFTLEEPSLLEKTLHVRKPNEKIMELIARTGISPRNISEWDEDRIAAFCKQAEINSKKDGVREPRGIALL